jgi:quercetin dioxygenase-like cupin family protein
MMFNQQSKDGYHSRIKGIDQKTLVYGEKTLLAEFQLAKGSIIPNHSHPNEQTGYLVSGRMVFIAGNERYDALPGDSWCIAAGVELFSPVREDYLPDKNTMPDKE